MRDAVWGGLNDGGRELLDVKALEILAQVRMMGGVDAKTAAREVADEVPLLKATLGHAAAQAGATTALLPGAQQRQRDAEARKAKEREKQRQAREAEDRLEVAKGQELETIDSLRPWLDGDWNGVQRRWLAAINRGLDNLAARIIDKAGSLDELQDIISDARPLLAHAADTQHQQAQIGAAQTLRGFTPAAVPITTNSWTPAANNALSPPLVYVRGDCRQPFAEPDHDDGDGEDYCPNPDCGERLVPDENWLDLEDVDSRPPESRPMWWDALRGVLPP
jgi:hypothetical protein